MLYKALRSEYSKIGFYMVLYLLLSTVVSTGMVYFYSFIAAVYLYMTRGALSQDEIMSLVSPGNNPLYFLVINAISIYAIGMPVAAHLLKKIPTPEIQTALFEAKRSADMFSPEGMSRAAMEGEAPDPDSIRLFPVPGTAPLPEKESFGVRDFPALFLISIFAMTAGDYISRILAGVVALVSGIEPKNTQVDYLLSGNLAMTIFFVVILAPVAEELFFRKFLITKLSHTGKWNAILVSAIIFALYHQNLFQFFYASFVGLILGYVYIKTGKVIYTMIMHISLNLTGGVLLPHFTKGAEGFRTYSEIIRSGDPVLLTTYAIYLLIVIAGLVCFIYYLKKGKFSLAEAYWIPDRVTAAMAYISAPGQVVLILACVAISALTMSGLMT